MAEQKTNVMRLLDQKKIPYRAHAYPHGDTAVDGVTVAGFTSGELTLKDASVILDAAKAAWLNARGSHADVSGRLSNVTVSEFATAYLCNLDIMNADASAKLEVSGISVNGDNVEISVTLTRTDAVEQKINGVLKFYGAATLAAFKDASATPISSTTLVDDNFSKGDTATATFDKSGDTFFNAAIEERK